MPMYKMQDSTFAVIVLLLINLNEQVPACLQSGHSLHLIRSLDILGHVPRLRDARPSRSVFSKTE